MRANGCPGKVTAPVLIEPVLTAPILGGSIHRTTQTEMTSPTRSSASRKTAWRMRAERLEALYCNERASASGEKRIVKGKLHYAYDHPAAARWRSNNSF